MSDTSDDDATATTPARSGDHEDRDAADDAQLLEVRQRLVRDGAAARIEESAVLAAIEAARSDYAQAPVRSFIGVLVERAVRRKLSIPPLRD